LGAELACVPAVPYENPNLKTKCRDIVIGLADPLGTKMYRYFRDGVPEPTVGCDASSIVAEAAHKK
jgi:hypothetical protein